MSIPEYIVIGIVVAPAGKEGQLEVKVITDFPDRFSPSSKIYINRQPAIIESTARKKGNIVIKINGIDNIGVADVLRGQNIEIHNSQLQTLPDDEYYHFQLTGLDVWTTEGIYLGKITKVLTTASNDVYVVEQNTEEILIPAIGDVVKTIDLSLEKMIVEPIEGLLELNRKKGHGA